MFILESDRLKLDEEFREILGTGNVYFQPPSSEKMKYDCIRYERSKIRARYANNYVYNHKDCYTVTLMYRDPDSELPHTILKHFKLISHDTHFTKDNLHHDVFTLYY